MPTIGKLQRITGGLVGIPPWQTLNLASADRLGLGSTPGYANLGTGYVAAQYRLWKLINEVEIIGAILASAAPINNTLIIPQRLPRPATIQQIPAAVEGNSAAPVTTPYVQVNTNGDLTLFNCPATTTKIHFHGWYSLDA